MDGQLIFTDRSMTGSLDLQWREGLGPLADRLHIETEEQVAHGGVADYDDFIDLQPLHPHRPANLLDLPGSSC